MYMQQVFLSAVKKQGWRDTERDTLGEQSKNAVLGKNCFPSGLQGSVIASLGKVRRGTERQSLV